MLATAFPSDNEKLATKCLGWSNIAAMKFAALLALSAFLLQQPSGCDQHEQAPSEPAKPSQPLLRRFEAVATHGSADVALDTKTGQLCRTWDWAYKDNPSATDLNELPTCYSIYQADQKSKK